MEATRQGGRARYLLTLTGIVAAALVLVVGASSWTARRIERDLNSRTRGALAAAGIDASVRFAGRDATVDGTMTGSGQEDAALTIVRGVWGIGSVTSRLHVQALPAPSASSASSAPSAAASSAPLWPQGSVSFASGSAILTPAASSYLDTVAEYLRQHGSVNVVIRGFADNVGEPNTNRALSQDRADTVAAYLAGHGIGTGRLRTQSFGDGQPVTSNDTPLGRSVNRRVELIFVEAN